jgi:hypothetical protein
MSTSRKPTKTRSLRHNERASVAGAGAHFTSPPKPRNSQKHTIVRGFGRGGRIAALRGRISAIKYPRPASPPAEEHPAPPAHATDSQEDVEMTDWVDADLPILPQSHPDFPLPILVPLPDTAARTRTVAKRLCNAWDLLLPQLVQPYTHYQLASHAQRPAVIASVVQHECMEACGPRVVSQVQCLYISRK